MVHLKPETILDRFHQRSPWNRFDEWIGIGVEIQSEHPPVFAFFGEEAREDESLGYKLLILRGPSAADQYVRYRSGEWIPEFGLDFGTTDGIKVSMVAGETVDGEAPGVVAYESCQPGRPPEPLRLDEKQLMFEVLEAINQLVDFIDQEQVPSLGETEDYCYHLWKVGGTWRADVREFPEEHMMPFESLSAAEARIQRIQAASLTREGVWEASSFFLPATRIQGDQEVFIQCAGIAERGGSLLGLVTLEAHADPDQEILEALLGSIETQKRMPQFLIVKEERVADRILPWTQRLGLHLRLRRRLRELERIRDEMIEEFPDDGVDE